jgi:hypothetical protein
MAEQTEKYTNGKLTGARIFSLILIAIVLVIIAWVVYSQTREVDAPANSTTESQPNSDQNSPGPGNNSVTQGGNQEDPATPSPSGTGANTILSR